MSLKGAGSKQPRWADKGKKKDEGKPTFQVFGYCTLVDWLINLIGSTNYRFYCGRYDICRNAHRLRSESSKSESSFCRLYSRHHTKTIP